MGRRSTLKEKRQIEMLLLEHSSEDEDGVRRFHQGYTMTRIAKMVSDEFTHSHVQFVNNQLELYIQPFRLDPSIRSTGTHEVRISRLEFRLNYVLERLGISLSDIGDDDA